MSTCAIEARVIAPSTSGNNARKRSSVALRRRASSRALLAAASALPTGAVEQPMAAQLSAALQSASARVDRG